MTSLSITNIHDATHNHICIVLVLFLSLYFFVHPQFRANYWKALVEMSLEVKLLQEHKEELLSLLAETDLMKFANDLYRNQLISEQLKQDFSLLDHSRLDTRLAARYLLDYVLKHAQYMDKGMGGLHTIKSLSISYDSDTEDDHQADWYWGSPTPYTPAIFSRLVGILDRFESTVNFSIYIQEEIIFRKANDPKYPKNKSTEISSCRSGFLIVLKEGHVPVLTEILVDCAHKWEEIGIALGVPKSVIEDCRNNSKNAVKLYNIIFEWVKGKHQNAKPLRLKSIKVVLKSPLVNMTSVADVLDDTFREKVASMQTSRTKTAIGVETQTGDIGVSDGKSTLLSAKVPNSELASYQWIKDRQDLNDDSIYSGVSSDLLLIREACQGIEGKYSCEITYGTETRTKLFINLTIIYEPEKECLLKQYTLEIPKESWPPITCTSFIELALIDEQRDLTEQYDYSIRGDMDDILKMKSKVKYERLFGKYKSGALVLIEGRPGSGKTTLVHKLTRDWAKGPGIFKGAKVVLLISLRLLSSKKNMQLSDILETFYNRRDSEAVTNMLQSSYGENACFIIDGLDEYSHKDDNENLIIKLIKKKYLHKAMVIVASRPIGTAELRHTAPVTRRIEVLGFSKKHITNYIHKYPFQREYEPDKLLQYLYSHVNVLHLCYLPMHAAMICYLYSQLGKEIPNTETKIYELFTCLTIKRQLQRDGKPCRIETLYTLDDNINHSFSNICRLAFDMTIQSKQTIIQSETDAQLSDSATDLHYLGLVTTDSTARLFNFENIYSFLHLTFQEFLAAFYIAQLSETDQIKIINDNSDKREMLVVWKFFCGLVKFTGPNDKKFQVIINSKVSDDLYRMQCAFESQQPEVCEAVFDQERAGILSFKGHTYSLTDLNAISYALYNISVPITRLVIEDSILDSDGIKAFTEKTVTEKLKQIKYFRYSKQSGRLEFDIIKAFLTELHFLECLDFDFGNTQLSHYEVSHLTHNVTLPCLKTLKIRMPLKTPIRYFSSSEVLEILSFGSTSLEQVQYSYCNSEDESHKQSLIHLLKAFRCQIIPLCHIPQGILSNLDIDLSMVPKFFHLSNLILINCNIDDSKIQCLANDQLDTQLSTLRLDFNRISCFGATFLSKIIKKYSHLRQLSFACNQIGDQGAITLAGALDLKTNLIELDLQCNIVGDEGAVAIAKAVKNFPASFELHLWNINITQKGVRQVLDYRPNAQLQEEKKIQTWNSISLDSPEAIHRAIECCAYLKKLNLSGRRISCQGIAALAYGLRQCINLQVLSLSIYEIDLDEICNLCMGLKNCKKLHTLNLADNKIYSDQLGFLASNLKFCKNLTNLNLSCNRLTKKAKYSKFHEIYDVAALARWLRSSNQSTSTITWNGFLILTEELRNYKSMQTWNLCDNQINSYDVMLLASGLKYCTNLSELKLCHNYIDEAGISALVYELKNINLRLLNLNENRIGPNGAAVLARWFRSGIELPTFETKDKEMADFLLKALYPVKRFGLNGDEEPMPQHNWCTSLEELDLGNNRIGSKGAAVLGYGLMCCSKLQSLSLHGNEIHKDGAPILASGLKHCHTLTTLKLDYNHFCSEGTADFFATIKHFKYLQSLSISCNNIGSIGASAITEGLTNCNNLRTLNFDDNSIGSHGAKALALGLRNWKHLTQLCLRQNNIYVDGAKAIANEMKVNDSLQILDLHDNNINADGGATQAEENSKSQTYDDLAAFIKGISFCTELKMLDLSDNGINSASAAVLSVGLKHCKNLVTLNLSCNRGINTSGSVVLADSLKFISLRSLNLNFTNIQQSGAIALASGLKLRTRLQSLCLSGNDICSEGAVAIADWIEHAYQNRHPDDGLIHSQNLEELDLSWNRISLEGATALAHALKYCPELQTLDLQRNSIHSDGAVRLAEGLKYCLALKILILDNNMVSSSGAITLANSLKSCSFIKVLRLSDNDIDKYGVKSLADILKYCTSLDMLDLSGNQTDHPTPGNVEIL